MIRAMTCPICGEPEARGVCARCGTDLPALLGDPGDARLEVAPVHAPATRARKA